MHTLRRSERGVCTLFSVWIPNRKPPLGLANPLIEGESPGRFKTFAPPLLPMSPLSEGQGKSPIGAVCVRPEAHDAAVTAIARNMTRRTNASLVTLASNENQSDLG